MILFPPPTLVGQAGVTLSGAETLLGLLGDTYGLAIDFTDQSMDIQDNGTPANDYDSTGTVTSGALAGPGGSLTYTSPSPKMTLQSDGMYKFQAHNLILGSNTMGGGTYWTSSASTITDNAATAPDGTSTACKVQATSNSFPGALTATNAMASARQFRVAFSVKQGANADNWLAIKETNGSKYLFINLVTGAIGTTESAWSGVTVTDQGSGWWRVVATCTAPGAAGLQFFYDSGDGAFAPSSSNGILYFAKWQIGNYPAVTDYIATTSAAKFSLPYEWNTSAVCQGVRIEPSATNLLTYSNTFSNGAWVKTSATVADAQTTGPDGTTSGALFTATSTDPSVYHQTTITAAAHTLTTYVKAGTSAFIWLSVYDGVGGGHTTWFNLSTFAVATTASGTVASITSVGNGWYRCAITLTTASGDWFYTIGLSDADNSTVSTAGKTAYLYNGQWELGSVATSPILTSSATVTRAADNISELTSAFPYSATAGTVMINWAELDAYNYNNPFALWGDVNNRIQIDNNSSSGSFRAYVTGNSVTSSVLTPSRTANPASNKLGMAWAVSDVAATANGSAPSTGASLTLPVTMTSLYLGQQGSGTGFINGYIKSFVYLPRRASNGELQTLTT